MGQALDIIKDPTLTYKQELLALARLGESSDTSLRYSDEYYKAKESGALCDLNEGVMPYKKAVLQQDIEEERRMFYVGMTRAENELYLYSVKNFNNKENDVSRFIKETKKAASKGK